MCLITVIRGIASFQSWRYGTAGPAQTTVPRLLLALGQLPAKLSFAKQCRNRSNRWRPFSRCDEYSDKVCRRAKKLGQARTAPSVGGMWGLCVRSQKNPRYLKPAAGCRKLASLSRIKLRTDGFVQSPAFAETCWNLARDPKLQAPSLVHARCGRGARVQMSQIELPAESAAMTEANANASRRSATWSAGFARFATGAPPRDCSESLQKCPRVGHRARASVINRKCSAAAVAPRPGVEISIPSIPVKISARVPREASLVKPAYADEPLLRRGEPSRLASLREGAAKLCAYPI